MASLLNAEKPVLCGYNNKHYDQWILRAIYHGSDPETIKALNDYIIKENHNDPWNFPDLPGNLIHPCKQFDLMDDLGGIFLRLKEVEGNLGMDIRESSVSFDIDRPLTDGEIAETVTYCSHDVDATERLFGERKKYLESKIAVGAMKAIPAADSLNLTNAKLAAAYLCGLGARPRECPDELEYDFPDNLVIDKYLNAIQFFSTIDPEYKRKLEITIAGAPHVLGWGGIHGALENYLEESTDERKIMHIDVTSYYPSLMIVNGYLSRAVPRPEDYKEVYDRRVTAKAAGDKATADALKLIVNTTYGAMKNQYNPLYDPHQANAVCISGQLYLVDLIEKLEDIPTFRLIQSNTDGLIVSCDVDHIPAVTHQVKLWEQRTGFTMGIDGIQKIVQKDVNNYVLLGEDDAVEVKGGYVSDYEGGDFKHRSLVIAAKALVENLLHGTPPADTIGACTDVSEFQMIAKAGSTYDKVVWESAEQEIEVQNVNRVYASVNKDSGTLYKIKLAHDDQKERRDKIANLPAHCCIDNAGQIGISMIDRTFYVRLAEKRINDYLGVKPEPKTRRKKSMATRKADTSAPAEEKQENPTPSGSAAANVPGSLPQTDPATAITAPGITDPLDFGAKMMKLRQVMDGFAWTKDGINRRQSYDYITEKQYKANFKKALAAAGLDFKSEMVDYQFIPAISDKMNMVLGKFLFTIIDRNSGEAESYPACGAGADMGDKGIYKAYTGAIKYFIANTFLVAEGEDPESDADEARADKPQHVTPERREEIKEKISTNDGPATDVQLETLADGIAALEDAGDKENAEAFSALLENDMTAQEAAEAIDAINALLEDGSDAA